MSPSSTCRSTPSTACVQDGSPGCLSLRSAAAWSLVLESLAQADGFYRVHTSPSSRTLRLTERSRVGGPLGQRKTAHSEMCDPRVGSVGRRGGRYLNINKRPINLALASTLTVVSTVMEFEHYSEKVAEAFLSMPSHTALPDFLGVTFTEAGPGKLVAEMDVRRRPAHSLREPPRRRDRGARGSRPRLRDVPGDAARLVGGNDRVQGEQPGPRPVTATSGPRRTSSR